MPLSTLTESKPGPASSVSRRRRIPGWLLPLALLLGFLGVFAVLFGEKLLPATEVQIAQVVTLRGQSSSEGASSSGQLLFQASGWLEPDPYAIQVPALVNGVVAEVHILEGETVSKGALLATLVDDEAKLNLQKAQRNLTTIRSQIAAHCSAIPELNASLETAKAKVTAEQARLAELEDTANRLKSLPEGAASLSEVTTAMLQVDRQNALLAEAKSEIPRIKAQLNTIDFQRIAMDNDFLEAESSHDLAKLALERHRITAPIDGRVLLLHAQPGKKRMLDMDDPKSALIVELYQPDQMQARIDVPLNEAAGLAVGQKVELTTDLLNDLAMAGTVTRITGEADIARNTLQVKVAITNPDDRLRPEMLVRAKFYPLPDQKLKPSQEPKTKERLLLFAATEALFDLDEQKAKAWIVHTDGTAQLRNLVLGPTQKEGYREVREGLHSGERLILPPFTELKEGMRIKPNPL